MCLPLMNVRLSMRRKIIRVYCGDAYTHGKNGGDVTFLVHDACCPDIFSKPNNFIDFLIIWNDVAIKLSNKSNLNYSGMYHITEK